MCEKECSLFGRIKALFSRLYKSLIKFSASSLISAGLDYVLVLLIHALAQDLGEKTALKLSVIGARVVSATVNYLLNRRFVFKKEEKLGPSLVKYAALAVCIMIANYYLMKLFTITLGWPITLAKLLVEVMLFSVSYVVQRKFVYRRSKHHEESSQ